MSQVKAKPQSVKRAAQVRRVTNREPAPKLSLGQKVIAKLLSLVPKANRRPRATNLPTIAVVHRRVLVPVRMPGTNLNPSAKPVRFAARTAERPLPRTELARPVPPDAPVKTTDFANLARRTRSRAVSTKPGIEMPSMKVDVLSRARLAYAGVVAAERVPAFSRTAVSPIVRFASTVEKAPAQVIDLTRGPLDRSLSLSLRAP